MRLTRQQQEVIKNTVSEIFGRDVRVSLFGSRVDDAARGGDIDLLIQTERIVEQREQKALKLVARLQIRLGDQPIDVVVLDPKTPRQSVHEEAVRTGVRL